MTDWKTLSMAQGLQLSDAELAKLAEAMDPLQHAYKALTADLTHDVEPATILAEEALQTSW